MSAQKTECSICATKFYKRNGGQRYCCRRCFELARTIIPAPKFCLQCGKKFTLLLNFKRAVFCSPQCSGLARRGEKHPLYKGGRMLKNTGYVQILQPDGKYAMEQRLVMEAVLGRPLLPEETVHHKNGDRQDNRPENLELWSSRHPKGQRVEDKTAWAVEWLRQYAPDLLALFPVAIWSPTLKATP